MQRRLLTLPLTFVVCALLALGLASCSSDSDSSDDAGAVTDKITISDFSFNGATVKAGATVTVENTGSTHTVTADNGEFDTGNVDAGATATFTAPATPGEYKYHCNIHSQMKGTLTVT